MSKNWTFQSMPHERQLDIVHTKGVYLHTRDGRRILDAAGGAVVVNLGHGRREVIDAMQASLSQRDYILPFFNTPEREQLATELADHWLPPQLTRMNFCSSGSDAVELAVKTAIQYQVARGMPHKTLVLTRKPSYHGNTLGAAAWSGHAARKDGISHMLTPNPVVHAPYRLYCEPDMSDEALTHHYLEQLEKCITSIGADRIAVMLAEVVTGVSGGGQVPPAGYWQGVQQLLQQHNILLIADEVITGFGRLGARTACEKYMVEPDILVAGKGLGGGYAAINGIFATDDVADMLNTAGFGPMYFTHSGAPMNCAAATTVLRLLREEKLVAAANQRGEQLRGMLREQFSRHPHVAEIRGDGLLIGIEVVEERESNNRFAVNRAITDRVIDAALRSDVLFYPGGTREYRDIICIGAPFIIDESHMEKMTTVLAAAIDDAIYG